MIHTLRARLVLGSFLWTIGLLAIVHIVSTALATRFPARPLLIAHSTLMSVVALGAMAAGFAQLQKSVSPFNNLRTRLGAVRDGRDRRVTGTYPAEVQPLVDDLNALLDHRERAVGRALAKAGDLAHGLKTPLAVLFQEADRVEAAGHHDLAATIRQQVARMRRQMDYHLAHARAAASGAAPGVSCLVADSADALTRTLQRLYAGRGIVFDVALPREHAVRVQREDLDEMLGNLLDNACKWAKSRIRVESSLHEHAIAIAVDDDGPGLDPSLRDAVLQRGVRADEAAPGWGFGLAIVRDLAELYGGTIALDRSPAGGLRAVLRLPAATAT